MAYFDTVNWIIGTATTATKTATTVMSSLDWVKLIIGAVTGASISSVVTIINTNRQFKIQRKKDLLQKKETQLTALNSIDNELLYNLQRLKSFKKVLEKNGQTEISFKDCNLDNSLKKDSWTKHSDTIDSMRKLDVVNASLHTFYYNLTNEINNQIVELERTKVLINQCEEIRNHNEYKDKKSKLTQYINKYYKE